MDFSRLEKTQPKVLKLLENSFKKNRLVHVFLFEGAKGTPKVDAAYFLANLLLCKGEKKPCHNCLECKRIESGAHPRIYFLEAQKDTIKKEQIDELEHEFSRKGLEEGTRIFIIKDIDKATQSASNALLKFLEEIKSDVYGIMTTESLDNVLLTIRSRSQIISFNRVSKEEIISEYLKKGVMLETSRILATITNDVDEGMEIIKEGTILDIIDLVKVVNESIVNNDNPFLVFYEKSKFLFDLNDKKYHYIFMDLLITATNDLLYKILGQDEDMVFENSEIDDNRVDYQKTFLRVEKMIEYKKRLRYNVNLELMYTQMFIDIMR